MAEDRDTRRRRRRPRRRNGARPQSSASGGASDAEDRNRSGRRRSRQGGQRGRGRPVRSSVRARRERQPENWWARRWIEVLESFDVGRRLGRGRSYARQGQVVDLELGKGFATAKVQGSRDAPYLVRMRFSMLSSTDWKKIVKALGEQAEYASRLVVGEIPENVERVFRDLDLSLFPSANGDLKTACSCPDQANPCKHIAAVYYLLGEELDRDPFLIFRLRGIERGELVDAIRAVAHAHGTPLATAAPRPAPPVEPEARSPSAAGEKPACEAPPPRRRAEATADPRERPPEPLSADLHPFWAGAGTHAEPLREARIPTIPAALPKRLGGFPFLRGEQDCIRMIERIYREASAAGLDVLIGASDGHEEMASD
jgi:uncharacterized Zn finger protein